MLLAILLATMMVVATLLFHYKVLLLLAAFVPRLNLATQAHVLIIVFALFLTHVAEIGFYAMVYAWAFHCGFKLTALSHFRLTPYRGPAFTIFVLIHFRRTRK